MTRDMRRKILLLEALVLTKELEENQENSRSTVMIAFCLRIISSVIA